MKCDEEALRELEETKDTFDDGDEDTRFMAWIAIGIASVAGALAFGLIVATAARM
jgi:hypothetical protein